MKGHLVPCCSDGRCPACATRAAGQAGEPQPPPNPPPRAPFPRRSRGSTALPNSCLQPGRAALGRSYAAEVKRIATRLHARIAAGDFSGRWPEDAGEALAGSPRFEGLERELVLHPWLADRGGALAVVAASSWFWRAVGSDLDLRDVGERGEPTCLTLTAAECLAHDVLAEAASRRWVRRWTDLRDPEPYEVRGRQRPRPATLARGRMEGCQPSRRAADPADHQGAA